MDIRKQVITWTKLGEMIDAENKKIKELKNKKSVLEKEIVSYMKTRKITDSQFQLGNNMIFLSKKEASAPLSLKLLTECLNELIANESQIGRILEHISRRRNNEKKTSYVLKKR